MNGNGTAYNVAVLGAGSWGTTFAKVLADAAAYQGHHISITIWARDASVAEEINTLHQNTRYMPQIQLPELITASSDLIDTAASADLLVVAVPAQSVRETLGSIAEHRQSDVAVMSLVKGLERGTHQRMSQVISSELGVSDRQILCLSGPNLAMEIAREEPTASVVSCVDEDQAQRVAQLCSAPYFRPYTNTDVIGVEIAGIVKNIIALAVGICDGQNLGDNSKASIITRGLAETTRLATQLGGRVETFSGLAGLGDLVATCASPLSRNRSSGRLLGQGLSVDEVAEQLTQTAEGVKSAGAVVELAESVGVHMPICASVVAVLEARLAPEDIAGALLARSLKSEEEKHSDRIGSADSERTSTEQ